MDILFFYMLIPITCLVVNVVIQILICRLPKRIGMLKSVFIGFFSGFAALFSARPFF